MAQLSHSHTQASINPLTLPLPSSQNNMLDSATKQQQPKSYLTSSENLEKRLSDGCYHSFDMNYDSRVLQPTSQIFANDRGWNKSMEDESGVSTPPLWRTSPSSSPPHRHSNNNYRCLSPSSKAQAIARGQRELMEMVSRMPESWYELSLKDLVENQHVMVEPKQDSFAEGRGVVAYKKKNKKQRSQTPQIKRSGSMDYGGFLLKMVFPISLGSKKNKKKNKNDSSSKVSSKPTRVLDASGKSVEKEWWKKSSGSSEGDSSGCSTINSGSTKSNRSSSTGSSSSISSCRSISISSRRHLRRAVKLYIKQISCKVAYIQDSLNVYVLRKLVVEGGYGRVYKGKLKDGQLIAEKVWKQDRFAEFNSEVCVLSFARHKNIVMLLGYCGKENIKIVLYEYVCNKSLHWHLFDDTENVLDWHQRCAIAIGTAKGLCFLHKECRGGPIIDRDLRPRNILLTHGLVPMLGDFGLSRRKINDDTLQTRVLGKLGYLAPEYAENGFVSVRTDVYAFGIVSLQLISGRRVIEAKPSIDPRILESYDTFQLYLMAKTAYICVQRSPEMRPSMREVLRLVEREK